MLSIINLLIYFRFNVFRMQNKTQKKKNQKQKPTKINNVFTQYYTRIIYIQYIYDIIYTYLLRLSMSERAAQRALAL